MTDPSTMIDRYTAAATALDKESLLALYAEDALLFDLMTPWKYEGRDAWRKGVDTWFATTLDDPRVEATDVRVQRSDEMSLVTCTMTYSHVRDGKREGMPNRLTWVLIADGGDWKIAHEHTSVPLTNDEKMQPVFGVEG